jgi:hypothetical protein
MSEKEIAQRIIALYHSQRTAEEKKQFEDIPRPLVLRRNYIGER